MEVNGEVAERIERRLDALGLRPEEVDAKVGLPPGTTERLRSGHGPIPGGRFLRGLCAALGADEAYLLGLEPGDLVPAELLVEPQRELGLLAPDEEALLKHYRSLSVPLRAAVALLVAKAAGAEEEQAEERGPRDAPKPRDARQPRKAKRPDAPRLFG
jgi:transcriptional regulator with XRE-family HTH domain